MSPLLVGPATSQPGLVEKAIGGDVATVQLRVDTITSRDLITASVSRWRTRPDARPEPAALSLTVAARAFASIALPQLGDDVALLLTPAALEWAGLPLTSPAAWRFTGQVTDVDTAPGTPRRPATVRLIAVGRQARTVSPVGGGGWPEQSDGARAAAILADLPDVTVGTVDTGTVTVMARPGGDPQPAQQLLDDLAADSGGELVELGDGTLEWHDAAHRFGRTVPTVALYADHLLASPTWRQQLSGLVNDLTLGYGPGSTQATTTVTDPAAIARVGHQAASRATQLLDEVTAASRANALVSRWGTPRWRLDGFTVDLIRTVDPARAGALLALTFGDLVGVDGLPDAAGTAANARLWVEGQTEEITRDAWRLQLYGSDYALGGPSPRWVDVSTDLSWPELDRAMTWQQAAAWVLPPPGGGIWATVAADTRWTDLDPAVAWVDFT